MRERVEIDAVGATGVELTVEVEVEAAVTRALLAARVVGPDEEEEGADEVASARFRLRVSIQNPKPLQNRESARRCIGDQILSDSEIIIMYQKP